MLGNIYKLKDCVFSSEFNANKYYIISDVTYHTDMYTLTEVSLTDKDTRTIDVEMVNLKRLFDLQFNASMNNWNYRLQTNDYVGFFSQDVLCWSKMIAAGYSHGCYHAWKKYTGFNEEYEYCEKCGEKRPVP
jgi:hypothetical protein